MEELQVNYRSSNLAKAPSVKSWCNEMKNKKLWIHCATSFSVLEHLHCLFPMLFCTADAGDWPVSLNSLESLCKFILCHWLLQVPHTWNCFEWACYYLFMGITADFWSCLHGVHCNVLSHLWIPQHVNSQMIHLHNCRILVMLLFVCFATNSS